MKVGKSKENPFRRGADLPQKLLNIAHRGGASLAPENTLAAGRQAFQCAAHLWEFDVRITGDGVPILMHDATLRRTTDVTRRFPTRAPWWVRHFPLEDIKELDGGSWFARVDPFGQIRAGIVPSDLWRAYIGEEIPTLQEALYFTKQLGWRANIEVKEMSYLSPQRIAQKVLTAVRELEVEEQVIVSSYDHRVLREIKKFDGDLPIAALTVFRPHDLLGYLEELGADAYHPSFLAFKLRDVAELREAGFGVNVGPYDAPNRLIDLATNSGVTGIFTNFPQRLEPILEGLY